MQLHDVLQHRRWLHRQATKMVGCPIKADDLVQETYIAILGKPLPDAPTRPWLRGVMRNVARTQARGEMRRGLREQVYYQENNTSARSPAIEVEGAQETQRLRAAIAAVPEPFRTTLRLRYIEERSAADIARGEGVPDSTIRWRNMRGLGLLRQSLTPQPVPRHLRRAATVLVLPIVAITREAAGYIAKLATAALAAPKLTLAPLILGLLIVGLSENPPNPADTGDSAIVPTADKVASRSATHTPQTGSTLASTHPPILPPVGASQALGIDNTDSDIEPMAPLLGELPPEWLDPELQQLLQCAGMDTDDPTCRDQVMDAIVNGAPICNGRQRSLVLSQLSAYVPATQNPASQDPALPSLLSSAIVERAAVHCPSYQLGNTNPGSDTRNRRPNDQDGAKDSASGGNDQRPDDDSGEHDDQTTAPPTAPPTPPQDCTNLELHIVSIHTSGAADYAAGASGQATIRVARPGRSVLVLSAYDPTHWTVIPEPGAIIERVILSGYYTQSATVPDGAELDAISYETSETYWASEHIWDTLPISDGQTCQDVLPIDICIALKTAGMDWRAHVPQSLTIEAERAAGTERTTYHGCATMSELTIVPHDGPYAPYQIPNNCDDQETLDAHFTPPSTEPSPSGPPPSGNATCGYELPGPGDKLDQTRPPIPRTGPCAGIATRGTYRGYSCNHNAMFIQTDDIYCSDGLYNCLVNERFNPELDVVCTFDEQVIHGEATSCLP